METNSSKINLKNIFYGYDKKFLLILFGQTLSEIGGTLTSFSMGLFVFQKTHTVEGYSQFWATIALPGILLLPFAGIIVDRFNRYKLMIIANLLSTICYCVMMTLAYSKNLNLNHIYFINCLISTVQTFHALAYQASLNTWTSKGNLVRINGLIQISIAIPQVLSPVLAGILLNKIEILGILTLDTICGVIGLITIVLTRLHKEGHEKVKPTTTYSKENIHTNLLLGWKFLSEHIFLKYFLIYSILERFLINSILILFPPFILSLYSEKFLSIIMLCNGIGVLLGGGCVILFNSTRLLRTIMISGIGFGLAIILASLNTNMIFLSCYAFAAAFCVPFMESSGNSLWQDNVPSEIQGRIFSIRNAFLITLFPIAALTSGYLATHIFDSFLFTLPWIVSIKNLVHGQGAAFLFLIFGISWIILLTATFLFIRIKKIKKYIDIKPL